MQTANNKALSEVVLGEFYRIAAGSAESPAFVLVKELGAVEGDRIFLAKFFRTDEEFEMTDKEWKKDFQVYKITPDEFDDIMEIIGVPQDAN
jgi:signal peptidase I